MTAALAVPALAGQLTARTDDAARAWLSSAQAACAADPQALGRLFPAAGRAVGRGPLERDADAADPWAWTIDDAARTLLLAAARPPSGALADLYRWGDAPERRAILRALGPLGWGPDAASLVRDALRCNDPRLVAAALGPWAIRHLDDAAFAHAVLKCVFTGIPLHGLAGALGSRATPELARMLAGYVRERVAAGRDVPAELWPWIDRHPPADELTAIEAELHHPHADRRRAAAAALAARGRVPA